MILHFLSKYKSDFKVGYLYPHRSDKYMADDIARSKEELEREALLREGKPFMRTLVSPRESKSQKAQYQSGGKPGLRKDVKTPMKHKET